MNLATIIGFIFGIALMSWASYDAAGTAGIPLMKLWSFVSLLIVVGGALAATAIAFDSLEKIFDRCLSALSFLCFIPFQCE